MQTSLQGWLKGTVDDAGLKQIQAAVQAAEMKTSGEIVPMIVRSSCTTGHVPWFVFFVLASALWAAIPLVLPYATAYLGSSPLALSVWFWDVVAIGVAFLVSPQIARATFIQRMFTPSIDQALSAERRALLEFYNSNIKATEGKTGVLVFVSLLEHRAIILADKAIADRMPKDTWSHLVQDLIKKIKSGDFAGGMCAAISSLGESLQKDFPRAQSDRNELGDKLIVKE